MLFLWRQLWEKLNKGKRICPDTNLLNGTILHFTYPLKNYYNLKAKIYDQLGLLWPQTFIAYFRLHRWIPRRSGKCEWSNIKRQQKFRLNLTEFCEKQQLLTLRSWSRGTNVLKGDLKTYAIHPSYKSLSKPTDLNMNFKWVRLQGLTAVKNWVGVFWDVTPYKLVEGYRP